MQTTPTESKAGPAPLKAANAKLPDIASGSVPYTLAALHGNPDTGLTHPEVDFHRKEHGYNEVAETNGPPVLTFLGRVVVPAFAMLRVFVTDFKQTQTTRLAWPKE